MQALDERQKMSGNGFGAECLIDLPHASRDVLACTVRAAMDGLRWGRRPIAQPGEHDGD